MDDRNKGTGEEYLVRRKQEFSDLQDESIGIGHKAARFFDENHAPRKRDQQKRERDTRRLLDALSLCMRDPEYEAAYEAAAKAVYDAQSALDNALWANSTLIESLERAAGRLSDGRLVFIKADGSGVTKTGEQIPVSLMRTLNLPEGATTYETYRNAVLARASLSGLADDIDIARSLISDRENPVKIETLNAIKSNMEKMRNELLQTPIDSNETPSVGAPDTIEKSDLFGRFHAPTPN
jgi:hypothetical protein